MLIGLWIVVMVAEAQTGTASIVCTVADPKGGVLVGAKLTIKNGDTNHEFTIEADTGNLGGGFPARELSFCIVAHIDFAEVTTLKLRDHLFFPRHWPVNGQ